MIRQEIFVPRVVIGEVEVEVKPGDVGRRQVPADAAEIMFTKKKSSVSGLVKEKWRGRGMWRYEVHGFLEMEVEGR